MWRNLHQGPHQSLPRSPQSQTMYGGRSRQRASTMSEQLVTPSPSNMPILSSYHHQDALAQPSTDDYFTYLSNHQQQQIQPHIIHIQSCSPPPPRSEINIPEIRLAPPNENQMAVPDFMNVHSSPWSSPLNSPGPTGRRTRGNSTHSLAPPPSILSECDSFVSARQSFLLSPSSSFNCPNELLSILDHARSGHQQEGSAMHRQSQLTLPPASPSDVHSMRSCCGPPPPPEPCIHIKFINEMKQVLLPTLEGWFTKSTFSRISAIVAVPLVLIFTLTLPVAEVEEVKVDDVEVVDQDHHFSNDDEEQHGLLVPGVEQAKSYLSVPNSDVATTTQVVVAVDEMDTKQGWNKHLLMAQCVISTTFIFGVFSGKKITHPY
jgi:hypothetical protein